MQHTRRHGWNHDTSNTIRLHCCNELETRESGFSPGASDKTTSTNESLQAGAGWPEASKQRTPHGAKYEPQWFPLPNRSAVAGGSYGIRGGIQWHAAIVTGRGRRIGRVTTSASALGETGADADCRFGYLNNRILFSRYSIILIDLHTKVSRNHCMGKSNQLTFDDLRMKMGRGTEAAQEKAAADQKPAASRRRANSGSISKSRADRRCCTTRRNSLRRRSPAIRHHDGRGAEAVKINLVECDPSSPCRAARVPTRRAAPSWAPAR